MNEEKAIRAAALQIAVTMRKLTDEELTTGDKDVFEEVIQRCLPLAMRIENYILTGV
jgi:hypothetical protein